MQFTCKFKVGDTVKVKPEHFYYADRWDFPRTGLKIKSISKPYSDDDCLVYFEGFDDSIRTSAMYAQRLELEKETQSMFAFGKKNPKIKKLFLEYTEGKQRTGLCSFVWINSKALSFLKSQIVFKYNKDYPVEHFILRNQKKGVHQAMDRYDCTVNYADPTTPSGKLRIWWATNLAIAASQGKI